VTSFTPDAVGAYSVVVSNASGSVTSQVANLSLLPNSVLFFNDFQSGTSMQTGAEVIAGGGLLYLPGLGQFAATPPLNTQNGGIVAFWFSIPLLNPTNSQHPAVTFGFFGGPNGALAPLASYTQPANTAIYEGFTSSSMDIPPSAVSTNSVFEWYLTAGQTGANQSAAYLSDVLVSQFVPPVIVIAPRSQIVIPGQNVTLTVLAEGDYSETYQWQFNGANVPQATGTSLMLDAVQSGNAGSYTVAVTNSVGWTVSAPAVVSAGYQLSSSLSGQFLTLSWPLAASSYGLETATNLAPPVSWIPLSKSIGSNSQRFFVTIPVAAASGYYRLVSP
jgi:hypothetical protein